MKKLSGIDVGAPRIAVAFIVECLQFVVLIEIIPKGNCSIISNSTLHYALPLGCRGLFWERRRQYR